jgi:hypothetical protein
LASFFGSTTRSSRQMGTSSTIQSKRVRLTSQATRLFHQVTYQSRWIWICLCSCGCLSRWAVHLPCIYVKKTYVVNQRTVSYGVPQSRRITYFNGTTEAKNSTILIACARCP